MKASDLEPPLLQYLVDEKLKQGDKLPNLSTLSKTLGVSVGKLREQLEYTRRLGLVSVKPKVGMRRESLDFKPAIVPTTLFGMATGEVAFHHISAVRRYLEASFWHEAVTCLTQEDKQTLNKIVEQAWVKLRDEPVHIPRSEHRNFHLTIFSQLDNPFVQGILSTYWDVYEASELTRLADYSYWLEVWSYHEKIAFAICENNADLGLQMLQDHFKLLPAVSMPAKSN